MNDLRYDSIYNDIGLSRKKVGLSNTEFSFTVPVDEDNDDDSFDLLKETTEVSHMCVCLCI